MDNRPPLVRRTLFANSLVTLLFGALLLVDRVLVAGLLGIASAVPVAIAGVICVAFAPVLLVASRKRNLGSGEVALLIAVDGAWVIASLVVAAVAPITTMGRGLIVAQSALVAVFMALESAGLRRLRPATA
jgi:hypothetical protein